MCSLDPKGLDLVVFVNDAFMDGAITLEASDVVVMIKAGYLLGNVGRKGDGVRFRNRLYVADLYDCDLIGNFTTDIVND